MSGHPQSTCYPISRVEETKASAVAGAFSVSRRFASAAPFKPSFGLSGIVAWYCCLVPQVHLPAVGRLTSVCSMANCRIASFCRRYLLMANGFPLLRIANCKLRFSGTSHLVPRTYLPDSRDLPSTPRISKILPKLLA